MHYVLNDYTKFRVIAHRNTLNSQNRRLWAVLHEIMSLYAGTATRLSFADKKPVMRQKDDVWWVVQFDYTNARPSIQFYLAVTRTFAEAFKLRIANHEQWKSVQLHEVTDEFPKIEVAHTKALELRPVRDNMFSFACVYTEQNSPIGNVLDVFRQLKQGDAVTLAYRFECVPRMKWRRVAEYSWQRWQKGGVPQRNRVKVSHVANTGIQIGSGVLNEALSVVEDTLKAIENSFFVKKESTIHVARLEFKDSEREQILVNGDLDKDTKNKQNLPVFRAHMQIFIHSENKLRRDMIGQSLAGSFVDLSGDNRLVPSRANKNAVQDFNALKLSYVDRDPIYLSTDEVGKLVQLPTADIQRDLSEVLTANFRTEIEVPAYFTDDTGIFMGSVVKKEIKTNVYLPTTDRDMLFTARAFVASPRMGKDTAIINFLVEAKRNHGIGALVLDVIDERGNERGMSDSLRDVLSPDDIIDLDFGDFDYPIYLGLQGVATQQNDRVATNRIARELTEFLMGDGDDAERTYDYLYAAAKAAKADPILIKAIFTNDAVRQNVIDSIDDGDVTDLLMAFDARIKKQSGTAAQIADPVLTRINKILRDDFLKPLFGQQHNPAVAWGKWIRSGKVVLVRVPSKVMGDAAVRVLMHWMTLVIYLTKIAGCGGEAFVVFNEPHQFESPGWVKFVKRIMLEGPKYRIAPIFAFHQFKILSNSLVNTLLSAGVNWHIGNNSDIGVFRLLEDVLEPTFTPKDAKDQVMREHFIAAWRDSEGQYQTPFVYHAPDIAARRYGVTNNQSASKTQQQHLYGRPILQVLDDIRQREKFSR